MHILPAHSLTLQWGPKSRSGDLEDPTQSFLCHVSSHSRGKGTRKRRELRKWLLVEVSGILATSLPRIPLGDVLESHPTGHIFSLNQTLQRSTCVGSFLRCQKPPINQERVWEYRPPIILASRQTSSWTFYLVGSLFKSKYFWWRILDVLVFVGSGREIQSHRKKRLDFNRIYKPTTSSDIQIHSS